MKLFLAVASALLALSAGLSWRLDRYHLAEGAARYPVPRLEVVQAVSTDFDNVLADAFWLQFLQYNGEKLVEDQASRVYEHLWEGLTLITGLDRKFRDAYVFGSWVLGDAGMGERAAELVEIGWKRNPSDARLPFQLGFVVFLYLDDSARAEAAFKAAAELASGQPGNRDLEIASTRMAAAMAMKRNQRETAIRIWRVLFDRARQSGDRRMQDIARRALERLGIQNLPADPAR